MKLPIVNRSLDARVHIVSLEARTLRALQIQTSPGRFGRESRETFEKIGTCTNFKLEENEAGETSDTYGAIVILTRHVAAKPLLILSPPVVPRPLICRLCFPW